MNKVDIILPTWNNSNYTIQCLNSIKEFTRVPFHIFWIDNGSQAEEFKLVENEFTRLKIDFSAIVFEKNQGFAKAINAGLKRSESLYVVLMNNDVVVTDGWLEKLIEILESNKEIGLVSPVTDHSASICQWRRLSNILKLGIHDQPEKYFNNQPSSFYVVTSNVAFFCMLLKREVINKIGLLDEGFVIWGNDNDYNNRARFAGFKTAIALNCFVYHTHSVTVRLLSRAEVVKYRRDTKLLSIKKRKEQNKAIK